MKEVKVPEWNFSFFFFKKKVNKDKNLKDKKPFSPVIALFCLYKL